MDKTALRRELERDEDRKLVSYQDSVGLWTIGVGHLLGAERRIIRITMAECDAFLDWDIREAETIVRRLAPGVPINSSEDPKRDVRHRVLTNMAFNLGDRLGQFKVFLGAVQEEDWTKASVAMMSSKWREQVGQRAVRLRDMILTGGVG